MSYLRITYIGQWEPDSMFSVSRVPNSVLQNFLWVKWNLPTQFSWEPSDCFNGWSSVIMESECDVKESVVRELYTSQVHAFEHDIIKNSN